jgi:glycosidase
VERAPAPEVVMTTSRARGALRFVAVSLVLGAPLAPLACGSSGSSPYTPPPIVIPEDGGASSSSGSVGTGSNSSGSSGASSSGASSSSGGGASSSSSGGSPYDGGTLLDGGPLPTTCPYTFSLPDSSYTTVVLQTDYLGWTGGPALTKSGSTWSVQTPVPNGKDVEYKFVTDGNWITNSALPSIDLPSSEGVNTNNILQAVNCGLPAPGSLQLVSGSLTTTASSYSFQVQFVPGGTDIDTTKTSISLNGTPVASGAVPYDATTHTFSVSVSSGVTSPNKYGYLFQVQDLSGQSARLFVPFWVQGSDWEWQDAFIYEVMVDRFLPGGTSKEGPNGPPTVDAGDWQGGDFGGVTQQINAGYFDAMGVNTLWLSSPVIGTKLCEEGTGANVGYCLSGYHSYFPVASGWTYGSENDPSFINAGITQPIDPHFGTAADLATLVSTAHAHGMRVLTDLVVNHVFADSSPPSGQTAQLGPLWTAHSTDQAWFNIPYGSTTNDCGVNGGLWDVPDFGQSGSQTWNRADCWFDPYLPDLNTTNPSADDAVANHAVWLMEQFNLDGFRVDAAKQVQNALCTDMRSKINAAISTNLPFYMVGESLGNVTANVMDCVGDTKFNGSVDDPLHNSLVGTVLQEDTNAASDLDNALVSDESTWTAVVSDALMGHFFGSHDTPRAISLAEGDSNGDPWSGAPPAQETNPVAFEKLQLAQAVLLTYDPIPILWMGDEFGQPGTIDPDCRRMMRFGNDLSALESGTLTNLQKLGTVRAAHSAFRRGTRTRLWVDAAGTTGGSAFYAYGRVDSSNGDTVIAAFNFSGASVTRTMTVSNIGLTGTTTMTDALSTTQITTSGGSVTITLGAFAAAVFTE